jgi:demethylmenaquinone methyltransferase / 2-methoxy-6-polyprenyl-1,4-benzoquinol methylase
MRSMLVTPYSGSKKSKKEQVAQMFDSIARRYDFLNHFLSAGIDRLWRKKAMRMVSVNKDPLVLDIATGTADFAIEALSLNPSSVTGLDISREMLRIGREKILKKRLDHKITLLEGDSEKIPFAGNTFDLVTVAFGVRNFEDLEKGLSEMLRVLKPGGQMLILEFSRPHVFPVKQIYDFYFSVILPLLGKLISSDKSAYNYLPESVKSFPYGGKFANKMKDAGLQDIKVKPLTFGIATVYLGKK